MVTFTVGLAATPQFPPSSFLFYMNRRLERYCQDIRCQSLTLVYGGSYALPALGRTGEKLRRSSQMKGDILIFRLQLQDAAESWGNVRAWRLDGLTKIIP